jgi:hypothetical protein
LTTRKCSLHKFPAHSKGVGVTRPGPKTSPPWRPAGPFIGVLLPRRSIGRKSALTQTCRPTGRTVADMELTTSPGLLIHAGRCIGNSGTPAFLFPIMWAYKQPRYLQAAGGQGARCAPLRYPRRRVYCRPVRYPLGRPDISTMRILTAAPLRRYSRFPPPRRSRPSASPALSTRSRAIPCTSNRPAAR